MNIQLTYIQDTKKSINKIITYEDGIIKKIPSASVSVGKAYKQTFPWEDFLELLNNMPASVAMTLGEMPLEEAKIIPKDNQTDEKKGRRSDSPLVASHWRFGWCRPPGPVVDSQPLVGLGARSASAFSSRSSGDTR